MLIESRRADTVPVVVTIETSLVSQICIVCPEKEIMEYENTTCVEIETDGARRVLHRIGSEVGR